jgi:hypothetical protein
VTAAAGLTGGSGLEMRADGADAGWREMIT